jgi:hypothetical protein
MVEGMSVGKEKSILRALLASLDARPPVARIEVSAMPLPVRHSVHWRSPGGSECLGTSRTLSILGLTFESGRELNPGENLEMLVDLPDGKRLTGLATVEEVASSEVSGWLVTVRFGDAQLTSGHEAPLEYLLASLTADG